MNWKAIKIPVHHLQSSNRSNKAADIRDRIHEIRYTKRKTKNKKKTLRSFELKQHRRTNKFDLKNSESDIQTSLKKHRDGRHDSGWVCKTTNNASPRNWFLESQTFYVTEGARIRAMQKKLRKQEKKTGAPVPELKAKRERGRRSAVYPTSIPTLRDVVIHALAQAVLHPVANVEREKKYIDKSNVRVLKSNASLRRCVANHVFTN